jgi:uncharacterized membrane protein
MANISQEDRILRVWTPIILRSILTVSTIVLIIGIVTMVISAPGYYVEHYRAAQHGRPRLSEGWRQLASAAIGGDPHSVLTIGLLVLTLVPLGRVAFTFFLFLRQGDRLFAVATAYVLLALIAGVMLGRIG